MKKPRVSVLVPFYNVERYLPKCLDSLEAQMLKDIEFICINDGSTDSSLEIAQRYAARDDRFQIIDKRNSGYGASMNCGMRAARGHYIGIVESDDFVSPDAFEELVARSRFGMLDIVKADYFEYDGADVRSFPFASFPHGCVIDPRRYPQILRTVPSIWAAIYKRSMLEENGISFIETPGASFQDTSFTLRSWMAARRVRLVDAAYLHYRVDRVESSVKSDNKVFEVCGEFACALEFCRADPARSAAFLCDLFGQQFSTYRWNYDRIFAAHHLEFAERWADEFRIPFENGELDESRFEPGDWALMLELLRDPAAFAVSRG